ncbi:MAG TPA: nuclear transport factor 2 family protein [Mycobacterium sp.]|nr:nuclear transport factor 2 family protein [Mycobacterium sp.]
MTSDVDRLAELEERLRRIEDERAIERMLAAYGPLVDAGEADAAAALWAADGSYDVEGWAMRGRDDVAKMVRSDAHQRLIGRGSAHFLGPAVVTVDGDDAVAVCESALLLHIDGGFVVGRAGANHFRLRRIDGRWQITARTTRALDGNPQARQLLADGVGGKPR